MIKFFRIVVYLSIIFCLFLPPPSLAETLDNDPIALFYKNMDSAISAPGLTSQFIHDRLDGEFTLNLTLGTIIESGPAQVTHIAKSKAELIKYMPLLLSVATVQNSEHSIAAIKLYPENNLAYVTLTTEIYGILKVAGLKGEVTHINFSLSASCVDTLVLKNNVILLKHSECNAENLIVRKE